MYLLLELQETPTDIANVTRPALSHNGALRAFVLPASVASVRAVG